MLTTTHNKIIYHGNNKTTLFPVPFPFFDRKDLFCIIIDPEGREQTPTALKWIEDINDNTVLSFTQPDGSPLPQGWRLIIRRKTSLTQILSLANGEQIDKKMLERYGLDRLVAMLQDLNLTKEDDKIELLNKIKNNLSLISELGERVDGIDNILLKLKKLLEWQNIRCYDGSWKYDGTFKYNAKKQ